MGSFVNLENSQPPLYPISCWLEYQARIYAFMLPLIIVLCVNLVFFVLVMRILARSQKATTVQWVTRLRYIFIYLFIYAINQLKLMVKK